MEMENIKLAVITEDREYGRALGLALVDAYKSFTVTLYKSEPLHKSLGAFDLVLTDQAGEKAEDNRICLVEKPSQTDRDYERRRFSLYKYSNVRQMAADLLFIYSFLTGRKVIPIKNQQAKIIVFCSAEGGAGCTSAAMAFAREMKRFHSKKVMYLSMEEMESTLEYMEPFPEGRSISEYLYHLFEQEDASMPFIESFLVFDQYGIDAFLPSPGRNVLKTLSAEEMQYLIGAALDTGKYDFLVVDAGSSLDTASLCCYEMADHICFIADQERPAQKELRMMEYLTFLKGEKLIGRMVKILNRCGESQTKGETEPEEEEKSPLIRIICRLPQEPESFSIENGRRNISADFVYGGKIRKLADSVLQNTLL